MKPQITERVLYDTSVMVRRVATVLRDMGLPDPDQSLFADLVENNQAKADRSGIEVQNPAPRGDCCL